MKTMRTLLMATMLTIAASAMASSHPKPQCDRHECTCRHDCDKARDPKRPDCNRCPECGQEVRRDTRAWPPTSTRKAPQQKQTAKQTRSFGSQQSRAFGSHR